VVALRRRHLRVITLLLQVTDLQARDRTSSQATRLRERLIYRHVVAFHRR
jgi:hypothetical protein